MTVTRQEFEQIGQHVMESKSDRYG
jgi:hypothetical protein